VVLAKERLVGGVHWRVVVVVLRRATNPERCWRRHCVEELTRRIGRARGRDMAAGCVAVCYPVPEGIIVSM
jgi:hypothetical protein